MMPRLKVYQFVHSEGDPVAVLAPNFQSAMKRFVANLRPLPDDPPIDDEQIESWIESIVMIADDVVTDDSGN